MSRAYCTPTRPTMAADIASRSAAVAPSDARAAASKAAQIGFVEALRAEYVATALHASVVYPISTRTEFREAIERNFGRSSGGLGPRQDPDAVARAIANCIASPKAEVYPYRSAKLLALMSVVAPALTDRFVQKYERRRRP